MDSKQIGYIEAHGTGTILGDRNEIASLKAFFGDNTLPRAYVGSVKSNIGHAMSASGILGIIKTALALYHRKIPPTLHCEQPLPAMFESRFMPPRELIDWDGDKLPLVAGVNAFGFGGANTHAILTAYEPTLCESPVNGEPNKTSTVSSGERLKVVKPQNQDKSFLMKLPRGAPPLLTELEELSEVIKTRYGSRGPGVGLPAETSDDHANPIAAASYANIRNAIELQREMAQLFEAQPAAGQVEALPAEATHSRKGTKFEEKLQLSFEDHPYLIDHSIVRQPKDWDIPDDMNPVVPFSMSLELFAEITMKYAAPGEKVIKMGNVTAYRWIDLVKPLEILVKGEWIDENTLSIKFGEYIEGECTVGNEWPEPPTEFEGDIDIGEEIVKRKSASEWYDDFSFHGPQYHSSIKQRKICERGMTGTVQKTAGKGSFLDIWGQQLGLFLHITQTVDPISFPVRLKEMIMYADIFDQDGPFENTIIVNRLTGSVAATDAVIKRDGKIWSVARGYTVQRFLSTPAVWKVILNPQFDILAEEIAPDVYFYANPLQDNVIAMLAKRYLSASDKIPYEQLTTAKQRREHVISRIALKDAVRTRLAKSNGEMLYPVQFSCNHDVNGCPALSGHGHIDDEVNSLSVSLSHKDFASIAIVSDRPVGIDLEIIEEKSSDFIDVSFTKKEAELLASQNSPEAVIRFWVAKEAFAKMKGEGLKGNPKRFEVSKVDGDILTIEETQIKTVKIENEYIAGWTI
jgi:phosphopantetheinyl transferase